MHSSTNQCNRECEERETWTKNGEMGRILFNIKSFEQKKKKPHTYINFDCSGGGGLVNCKTQEPFQNKNNNKIYPRSLSGSVDGGKVHCP